MVNNDKKGRVRMPFSPHDLDDLEQIHELNRLFLAYLRAAIDDERNDCLGLGAAGVAALKAASERMLGHLAEAPRALFRLRLGALDGHRIADPVTRIDRARQALQLTVLLMAWNLSRRDGYGASLFLGLSHDEVRRLRLTPISELHELALGTELVACAFAETEWLWCELLTETHPEYRQQLMLLSLQPVEAIDPGPAPAVHRRALR
jgi:hypothetical protein